MSQNVEPSKLKCCYSCLCTDKERHLHHYLLQNAHLRTIFQEDSIVLCYICKRIAQHAELFILNVQSNQILLENLQKATSTFQAVKTQTKTSINLQNITLNPIVLLDNENAIDEQLSEICRETVTIKVEMKEEAVSPIENLYLSNHLEDDAKSNIDKFDDGNISDEIFKDGNTNGDSQVCVKGQEKLPQQEVKVEFEDTDQISLDKEVNTEKNESKKAKSKVKKKNVKDEGGHHVERIYITNDQYLEERAEMTNDEKYINSAYKCTDCVKGFGFKPCYDNHMKLHSESSGPYKCDVCTQHMETEEKLLSHKKYSHYVRYKCKECGLTRKNWSTINDHYTAFHCQKMCQFVCPYCSKSFTRSNSLRNHIINTHTKDKRVLCPHCNKQYANKEVLKNHLNLKHPKEVSAVEREKRYACQECNMAFSSPSLLNNHMVKHSSSRNAYCIECNKSFKSKYILQQHFKTAAPHANHAEKSFQCDHCDKNFSLRRDVEVHLNKVHLNRRPYECDLCDKAYAAQASLTQHKRLSHGGFKRPLKFPCDTCDKVFDRLHILKSHVRMHTGERPYQCSECPATFGQPSTLRTHKKLIHLKLTRDGTPKHDS